MFFEQAQPGADNLARGAVAAFRKLPVNEGVEVVPEGVDVFLAMLRISIVLLPFNTNIGYKPDLSTR